MVATATHIASHSGRDVGRQCALSAGSVSCRPIACLAVVMFQLSRRAVGRIPGAAALVASAFVWVALLGPLAVLLAQVSPHTIRESLDQPGAWTPLWTSLEASAIAPGPMVLLRPTL